MMRLVRGSSGSRYSKLVGLGGFDMALDCQPSQALITSRYILMW